jgi:hypothetical protein
MACGSNGAGVIMRVLAGRAASIWGLRCRRPGYDARADTQAVGEAKSEHDSNFAFVSLQTSSAVAAHVFSITDSHMSGLPGAGDEGCEEIAVPC